jgi:dTDP-4-amino-4,6-dideoxygalactose transaminase
MNSRECSSWPNYSDDEIRAVTEVLRSNRVNQWTGTHCFEFEREFASFVGTKFAVALSNGTVALELALRGLGVGHGDDVIVTSRSFIASASCVVTVGAKPIFADVDYLTQNISIDTIKAVVTNKTKAIIVVHVAGWPVDLDPIMEYANANQMFVIEDCAQAHGAKYKGRSVGSIGHVGAWSFCQDKIMTTGGEGGMVTCNNKKVWETMWSYKDHGKNYDLTMCHSGSVGFKWVHKQLGSNLRMTEMQAALGRVQLRNLHLWTKQRQANALMIWNAASKLPGVRVPDLRCGSCNATECMSENSRCAHAAYRCYIFIEGGQDRRDRLLTSMNSSGIPVFTGICPEIYLEDAFKDSNWVPKVRFKNARALGEESLAFLCHPNLTKGEIQKMIDALKYAIMKDSCIFETN